MQTPDLARMRDDYADTGLDETDAGSDPVALFERWLTEAVEAGVHEPNAMALATASPDGVPSSRIVLLKGFDAHGLVFFTGYGSRKGRELEANPRAAATMLDELVERTGAGYLETTITADNAASIALFSGLAQRRGAGIDRTELFGHAELGADHDPEFLYRIGPLNP